MSAHGPVLDSWLFPPSRSHLRECIDAAYCRDESECVQALLPMAHPAPGQAPHIFARARRLASAMRLGRARTGGVDALMHEFSLSTEEGVALMCLAEALLRVPDAGTVDRLIEDRVTGRDWASHLGHSPSLFVNAATWGLLFSGRVLQPRAESDWQHTLASVLARGGEPLVRRAMVQAVRLLGDQFVAGDTIDRALDHAHDDYLYSFDMLGEAALTEADAQRYFESYRTAAQAVGRCAGESVCNSHGISVKLSALHPRYAWSQHDRVMRELLPRLRALCEIARAYGIGLNIDAEEADRLEPSLDVFEALALDPGLDGWDGLGFVVQAYQKRAPQVIDWLVELARRSRRRLMVRLVKGAYWDTEIKRAQIDGLDDYPVFTRKRHTDAAFLACARKLLNARQWLYPQLATHNAQAVAAILDMAGGDEQGAYEFQCLHGMGESLYGQLLADPELRRPVRIYAPVGEHRTLLPYLVRRLLENGANSSFVNRIVDESLDLDALVADPAEQIERIGVQPHPRIALPSALFAPSRKNAAGLLLASPRCRALIAAALRDSMQQLSHAVSLLAGKTTAAGTARHIVNPGNLDDVVGEVTEADEHQLTVAASAAAAAEWLTWPASRRAEILDRVADAYEQALPELTALLIREAGKSWPNAVAEVREAVDFCRYYACRVRELEDLELRPWGVVVCISPWNFPLAIFTGQVVAALGAGNTVLAKPAEQTPLIAAEAVRRMHAAGVPADALQLLLGEGETVGAALVRDARVQGVLFTGSTAVAADINAALARREHETLLVAETGGQNAMIVDSTALPEQVVTDVLVSAFDSAGQRCSALRVLCLQEEVADEVLTMLRGAMSELRMGDMVDVRNDIGPVIEAAARDRLERYLATRPPRIELWRPPLCNTTPGHFVTPALLEIASLAELEAEQFGPVLHVLRYLAGELDELLDQINALGYGLTLGVHSRIEGVAARVAEKSRVGNLYVNRNMVGAVVGSQPFGGEGLSGTGPKAGGPLYLHRLMRGVPFVRPSGGSEPSPVPAFETMLEWLRNRGAAVFGESEYRELLKAAAHYRGTRLNGCELILPGPTGEHNSLRFAPLERVVCVADMPAALMHQLLAALSHDVTTAVLFEASNQSWLKQLPEVVTARILPVTHVGRAAFDVMLFAGEDASAMQWRRRLAARGGVIVPLLRPEPFYDGTRLVRERALSINTAAAGGNVGLMAMDG